MSALSGTRLGMKRLLDVMASLFLLVALSPLLLAIAIAVRLTSSGGSLHWSNRVGRENRIFRMPKYRSMRLETPQVATHLLNDANKHLTPIGGFLRRTSLDELPQLWSILRGDLTLVGPRPALFNQKDLVDLRTQLGIHHLRPGLTGWAQVNGRDELSIEEKAKFDHEYLERSSFKFDLQILWLTLVKSVRGEGIKH